MRTSRVSRETARVVDALSPSKRSTRSLRRFARNVPAQKHDSDSELSSAPSSSEPTQPKTLGKRKRPSAETPATSITSPSVESTEVPRKPTNRKPKRQSSKRIKTSDGATTTQPPANWEELYTLTQTMRSRILAPVDTMGCESLADRNKTPQDQRLQTLVSLMLSSQTKDTTNAAAMRNLQLNLPGGFNLQSLLDVDPARLNELIWQVGFHNNKTRYIKATASILSEKFAGDIPDTIEGLVSLPGVGPKMAYLCMSAAWGRDEGIGVDVHVHRITNLWGWHRTSTPEQTRGALEAWLPRERWHEINGLLVGLGQTVCLPVGRRCGECELGVRDLCPGRVVGSPRKKAKREVKVEGEDTGEVKSEVVVEADDSAKTVVVKTEDLGNVESHMMVPDIEGLGAGSIRKLIKSANTGT